MKKLATDFRRLARRSGRYSKDLVRRLDDDTDGAMMVFYVFAAVALFGFLYFLIGTGLRVHTREMLQNSTDAGAFGAAVVKAKILNLMALMNQVMSAVIAIPLTYWMMGEATEMAGLILYGVCCAGCSVTACCGDYCGETYKTPGEDWHDIFDMIGDSIEGIATGAANALGGAQEMLSYSAAYMAWSEGEAAAEANWNHVSTVIYPMASAMPVEKGEWDDLCADHAHEDAQEDVWVFFMWGPTNIPMPMAQGIATGLGDYCDEFSDNPEPMIMEEDWATSGNNQVRAYVYVDDNPDTRRDPVQIATWQDVSEESGQLSGQIYNVAQAEFYSLSGGSLWEMTWLARMRRFYEGGDSPPVTAMGGSEYLVH